MTETEIRAKMDALLESNKHWKSCQDGSYEMALSMSGYYDLRSQLNAAEDARIEAIIVNDLTTPKQ
jgi:hypothetical protein